MPFRTTLGLMTRSLYYPPANRTAEDFDADYSASKIAPNCLVIHTTEGTTWPTYEKGSEAPHLTGKWNAKTKKIDWRQHFPLDHSARGLVNLAGGVETNTLNVAQIELIGTCDPTHKGKAGWLYWPAATDTQLEEVAKFIAWMHTEWALKLQAPKFQAYPASYGARGKTNTVRFTNAQWENFYGICGHEHVPENVHGDPGNIDIQTLLNKANAIVNPPAPKTPASTKKFANRADHVVALAEEALKEPVNQQATRNKRWNTILNNAKAMQ